MKRSLYFIYSIVFILLFSTNCLKQSNLPKVKNGVLDLRTWKIDQDPIVPLEGEWNYYHHRFIQPSDFLELPPPIPSTQMEVPGSWNEKVINSEVLTGDGYGTYHLKILLSKNSKITNLALKFNFAATSAKYFVNGKLIHEQGTVGLSRKNSVPSYKTEIKTFDYSEEVDIIVHCSNFFHRRGGLWQQILLGTEEDIIDNTTFALFYDFTLFGVLFIMAIYHLGLFMLRREEKTYMFFSIFCFLISVRILFTGETWITTLVKNIDWTSQIRVEYFTFYFSLPIFASFVYYLYPKEFNLNVLKIFIVVDILFLGVIFTTPPIYFSNTLPYFQIFMVVCGSYCLYVLVRAIFRKRMGAIAACLGWLVFFVAILADVYINEVYGSSYLTPFGLFVFIFSQSFILSLIFSQTFRKTVSLTEHLRSTNLAYSRFVPADFIDYLKRGDITEVVLGDQTKTEMTVLFCDIRDFTGLTEKISPEDTFRFLNAYLRRVGPVIRKNNGFIDKFMGDGIMALFPKSAEDALKAAVQIQEVVREYNIHRLKSNYQPVDVGIGIHIGNLMLGTIGESDRMDATVISDAVNLASRLEGLTKVFGAPILISDETLQKIETPDIYNYRLLGKVQVKGKKQSVGILEIIEGNYSEVADLKLTTKAIFEKAIFHYLEKNFDESIRIFKNIYEINPADKASLLFLNRSLQYKKNFPDANWQGVEIFEYK
jgi:class 3 adenylate cyclase